jgi:hypothetical protein
MTVYYLAGPMAGYPEHNHPAFHQAAEQLRKCGYTVVNPAEYGNLIVGWKQCMKRDLHALLWCTDVIVLPGWEKSKGTQLETYVARALHMPVHTYSMMLYACRQQRTVEECPHPPVHQPLSTSVFTGIH